MFNEAGPALLLHFRSFERLQTIRHGAQGSLDTASKATLENEFGTSIVEDVIKKIIEKGSMQESEVSRMQFSQ